MGGWLEKLVFNYLDARQRLVAECMLSFPTSWSAGWRQAWVVGSIALAIAWLWPASRIFAMLIGGVWIAGCAWPVLGGNWLALSPIHFAGTTQCLAALYPISFREIARVVLTCNLLRMLLCLPQWLVFGAMGAVVVGSSVWSGLRLGLLGGLLGMLLQPLAFIAKVSPATNDAQRFRGPKMLLVLTLILLMVGLGALVLVAHSWIISLAGLTLMGLISTATFCWYRRSFERTKFDWFNNRPVEM